MPIWFFPASSAPFCAAFYSFTSPPRLKFCCLRLPAYCVPPPVPPATHLQIAFLGIRASGSSTRPPFFCSSPPKMDPLLSSSSLHNAPRPSPHLLVFPRLIVVRCGHYRFVVFLPSVSYRPSLLCLLPNLFPWNLFGLTLRFFDRTLIVMLHSNDSFSFAPFSEERPFLPVGCAS